MEERVPEGHVEDLTYLEPRRLAFENTSASVKRVVPVVTPDHKVEIIRQLQEDIVELRRERSTPAERMSPPRLHQLEVSRPEVSHMPYYSKIITYDEEQQAQSLQNNKPLDVRLFPPVLLHLGIS
ncbi:hypothetical protein RJT34_10541 [Clitoria ternatea]|uniref:Uncharacterized protein n=1 Tax=Clitoria ternatea TaxID=43366 RepID=A0AAN9K670_CLITE